jgi:transposase-like protein
MGKGIKEDARAQELEPVSLSALIHQHVRIAIETAVYEELRAALGASPYERSEVRRGYRNGIRERTLTGPTGPVALALPRATLFRGASAKERTSTIVPRYQRRMPEVNDAIVATYLAGGNTHRIRGALQPLLKAAPLSKSAVSRVIATLKDGLEAWRTRSLAAVDVIYLCLDGFFLRVRSAGKVVSVPVLGMVGVLADGSKHLLALELCGGESFEAWKGCPTIFSRGASALRCCASSTETPGCGAPSGWCGRGRRCNAAVSTNCATWSGKRRSTRWRRSATTSTASSTRPMLTRPALPTRPSSARGPSAARAW